MSNWHKIQPRKMHKMDEIFQFEKPYVFPQREQPQTKLIAGTSLFCHKHFRKRKRVFYRSGPLKKSECDPHLPERQPRVSTAWYLGWLSWFIAPQPDSPWFQCSELAQACSHPECTPVWVHENAYIRQFGRARLYVFWIQDHCEDMRDILFSKWWMRRRPPL